MDYPKLYIMVTVLCMFTVLGTTRHLFRSYGLTNPLELTDSVIMTMCHFRASGPAIPRAGDHLRVSV